ncbi:MAG: ribosome maturation factor RimP [Clostridiales bacterium]
MKDKLAERIQEKAVPIIRELGYELADMELVKEGANWYLRFFIEHLDVEKTVDIDDCQKVSERLSDWLDETDPIPQAYFLEVSSPGIERPLKKEQDFIRFKGSMVEVSLFAPFQGKKNYVGSLGTLSANELFLVQDDRDLGIPREMIASVHLYWDENGEG